MPQLQHAQSAYSPSQLSGAALRTFFNIAEAWKLTVEQQRDLLGAIPNSTFFKWKKDAGADAVSLPKDTLERISYILGIFKSLQILLPRPEQADTWIKRENDAPLFGGKSALERMLSGNVSDLFVVRQYLDTQRGW